MAPNSREQIGTLPGSLDFRAVYSQLKGSVLSEELLPTSITNELALTSYNFRILDYLGLQVLNQDLSQPTELSGGHNGNQWWINTTETNEYGESSTTISYRTDETDWVMVTYTTEQLSEQRNLKTIQLKIQGIEELVLAELSANQNEEVFSGLAAAPLAGEATTGLTQLIKFIVENIEDDQLSTTALAPLRPMESTITLRGELEPDQNEIMVELEKACGIKEAYRIMSFLFFNGATSSQWVDTMHQLTGSQHSIDMRSEARVAIQNNLIGKMFLGGIKSGISLAERLTQALGSDFDIPQLSKSGDKYLYNITYPDGGTETVDEEKLVSLAKYVVMRFAIDNAQFKNGAPQLEG